MNMSERLSYPVIDAAAAAPAAAWGKVRDVLLAWLEARGRSLAIRQLRQLSDRTLRDIGLERGDIHDAVQRGRRPW